MCDRPDCDLCRWMSMPVREPEWCMECGLREIGEGLTRCVLCEAEKPRP